MKPVILLASSLLFIATPALAAPDPDFCISGSMQLEPAERNAHIESCMAQVSSPANVKKVEQQYKMALCEQNAKNCQLRNGVRSNYIAKCITYNEAAMAANRVSAPATVPQSLVVEKSIPFNYAMKSPASLPAKSAGSPRSVKLCAQRAKDTGLKGDERKRFITRCTQG